MKHLSTLGLMALVFTACDDISQPDAFDHQAPAPRASAMAASGLELHTMDDEQACLLITSDTYRCIEMPASIGEPEMVDVTLQRNDQVIYTVASVEAERSENGVSAEISRIDGVGNTFVWLDPADPDLQTVNVLRNGNLTSFQRDDAPSFMLAAGEIRFGPPGEQVSTDLSGRPF